MVSTGDLGSSSDSASHFLSLVCSLPIWCYRYAAAYINGERGDLTISKKRITPWDSKEVECWQFSSPVPSVSSTKEHISDETLLLLRIKKVAS